ncbi:MAG: ABC transporter ATP-binding protein [Thermoanaerobaculia bacterium]
MKTPAALSARGIGWSAAGRRIVGPIDLDIRSGERLVVVGPNGAGKTTLLRLLVGLIRPDIGALQLEGRPLAGLSRRELARRIAYVPQIRPARVPFDVEQMVLLGRYPYLSAFRPAPASQDYAAVEWALDRVGIAHLRSRRIDELSGGERQTVYIAAALAQEADLLILDEPTTHLDPRHQREVASLLVKLNREAAKTVVCATHDLNFAAFVGQRILALREGSSLICDAPARVLRPALLAELFEAPFAVMHEGERPVTVLELGP